MGSKERPVNHEMVILARESRGFTQKELARRLDITQGALSRIESGLLGIDGSHLKKLSDVLGYPSSFFSQRRLVYGLGLVEVFHRKRQSVGIKALDKVYSLIDIRTTEIAKMLKGVDFGDIDFPCLNIEDYDDNAAEIARMVKAQWHVPHGPVQNLTAYIERARGIVVPFDFENCNIDAISHWLPGLPPLIFANKFITSDRLRFTIAHELGHIVMHQKTPTPEIEKQANMFAAEFLMPERDVRPYLVDLSIEKLASLKPYWKVAMSALLKRAVDLRTISERHGRTLWMQISKSGYKSREPMELDLPTENPTLLRELVMVYLNDMGYQFGELATLLHLRDDEAKSIYLSAQDQNMLVLKEAEAILRKSQ